MKTCPNCNSNNINAEWQCYDCAFKPQILEDFKAFDPELSLDNEFFNSLMFENFAKAEKTNFWLQSRKNLIFDLFKKYCLNSKNFLEMGCGTGYILSEFEKNYPDLKTYGTDIYIESLAYTKKRTETTELFQMNAYNMPFKDEFDCIGAFDVLEHIENDVLALSQINKALAPSGIAIIIVPQHMFLWSKSDEYSKHARRYERAELIEKLEKTGYELQSITSFISFLMPLVILSRFKKKFSSQGEDINDELNLNPILNHLLTKELDFERALIKQKVSLPFGSSLVAVAKKV